MIGCDDAVLFAGLFAFRYQTYATRIPARLFPRDGRRGGDRCNFRVLRNRIAEYFVFHGVCRVDRRRTAQNEGLIDIYTEVLLTHISYLAVYRERPNKQDDSGNELEDDQSLAQIKPPPGIPELSLQREIGI